MEVNGFNMPDLSTLDYLDRPLVKDMSYTITDTRISIQCPHTSYLETRLFPRYEKKALLETYHRVLHTAKSKGVSISYQQHFKKTITGRWAEYEAACKEQEALFGQITAQAKVVQERGVHMGTCDDLELKKLQELDYRFQTYHYGTSVISAIGSVSSALNELDQLLSNKSTGLAMITL